MEHRHQTLEEEVAEARKLRLNIGIGSLVALGIAIGDVGRSHDTVFWSVALFGGLVTAVAQAFINEHEPASRESHVN